jgi:hypothetical protein
MSWQRINENTYLDDTLVTSAEYQLFIDEMRQQGKYYQPDHWRTHQFPLSHGKKPITGVRTVTAQSFCEWLSHDGHGEYEYRLPTSEEAMRYRIKLNTVQPLGYWTLDLNNTFDFIWVASIPIDVGFILRRRTYASLTVNRTQGLYDLLETAINRATNRAVNLNGTDVGHRIDLARQNDREVLHLIRHARATTLSFVINSIEETKVVDEEIATQLDHYIDLIALQERIAGRCPAFEGIRLVKERK